MLGVCCLLFSVLPVTRCLLCDACCLLLAAWGVLVALCLLFVLSVYRVLFVACLFDGCLLFIVCCLLCVVCRLLCAVRFLLAVA